MDKPARIGASLRDMTLEQRRQMVDTSQVWSAWQAARARADGYRGSLGWQTVNGDQYLVRRTGTATARQARSLGRRSETTETLLHAFEKGRLESKQSLEALSARLKEYARYNRALRLNRVPPTLAKIARVLDRQGLLGKTLTVVGTNAIFAYEAHAGVVVDSAMLATGDLDVLYDARTKLRLLGTEDGSGLLGLLQQADRSFVLAGRHRRFCAHNADGYQVDLIKAPPRDVLRSSSPDSIGGADDLQAAHIPNMRWILNAPKFEAMAIGADGYPLRLVCPDPRAFALYKLWMGTKDSTREPLKRKRDMEQAHTVAAIVNGHLPFLPFEPDHLACFPRAATELAEDADFFRHI